MKRFPYQMSTLAYQVMQVGRLQTIYQFPVIANDSVGLAMPAIFRLSPLRRNLSVDARVDLFAFFVPHRHVYGADWVNFLMQGVDENITLPSWTAPGGTACLGYNFYQNTVVAKHVVAGYNQIWNRYFRFPSDRTNGGTKNETWYFGEVPDNANPEYGESFINHQPCRSYGRRVCWLKDELSTGIVARTDAADRSVGVTSGEFDTVDLERAKGRYKSELTRDYEVAADRYTDLMRAAFGASPVNTDADQRPTLLAHQSQWLSGYDVNGTGDASLGQYAGRGEAQSMFGFPRRYFKEHGTIHILSCIRYPTFRNDYIHFLALPNRSYKEQAGDPPIVAAEPPIKRNTTDFFPTSVEQPLHEDFPYGQWYRTLPLAYAHPDYDRVQGFPFTGNLNRSSAQVNNFLDRHYVASDLYDTMFQTVQLSHCQVSSKLNFDVQRIVPPAGWSIQAGAK